MQSFEKMVCSKKKKKTYATMLAKEMQDGRNQRFLTQLTQLSALGCRFEGRWFEALSRLSCWCSLDKKLYSTLCLSTWSGAY